MEIKVFYVLFDMTESNCGNLWLVPGSYKRCPQKLRDMEYQVPAEQTLELRLPAGSAVLWRTATWHCVGPNQSPRTRKIMHVGYHYRWLRPDRLHPAGSGATRALLADSPAAFGCPAQRR